MPVKKLKSSKKSSRKASRKASVKRSRVSRKKSPKASSKSSAKRGRVSRKGSRKASSKASVKRSRVSRKNSPKLSKCNRIRKHENCEASTYKGLRRCRYNLTTDKCSHLPFSLRKRATVGVVSPPGGVSSPGKLSKDRLNQLLDNLRGKPSEFEDSVPLPRKASGMFAPAMPKYLVPSTPFSLEEVRVDRQEPTPYYRV